MTEAECVMPETKGRVPVAAGSPGVCSAAAAAAAAATKSLQSCPTLCDPIGGSPLTQGKKNGLLIKNEYIHRDHIYYPGLTCVLPLNLSRSKGLNGSTRVHASHQE